ncbi:MFS transporter [Acholeplasma granularum]|uniref:MFS transporter n=1 Tax=Acholeplasma granularum TaxID=264635 RepID=UPI0004ACDD89|nr:MFS transporter [Acholeplasma granularum]
MQEMTKKHQIITLISGILIELILGTVYAYSIVRLYLENEFNLNHTQSSFPYLTSLAFFSLFVMISGRYINKDNFIKWLIYGVLLVGFGYIISGLASNYLIFTVGYGVLVGIGVGILYGIPITIIQKVFQKRQGIAVGFTIAGFGLSTVITAPILQILFDFLGFKSTFLLFGLVSVLLLSLFSHLLIKRVDISLLYSIKSEETPYATKSVFVYFFIIFMFGIMFGLAMIGLTVFIGMEYYGLNTNTISLLMIVFALSNGLARPIFGYIYDKYRLKFSVILLSLLTIIVSTIYIFFDSKHSFLFITTFILSWATVGGWLALMPLITKEIFGLNSFSKTYGKMYLSYGLAAIIGNLYTGVMIDKMLDLSIILIPILIISVLTIFSILFIKFK